MKFLVFSLLMAAVGPTAQLKDVKSVYFYPMAGGFEQHLANRIVQNHVYQVVSDPKLADAIFTDSINEGFLYKLDHLHAPPPPPTPPPGLHEGSITTVAETPRPSTFSRTKGTLFLVDTKSKQVVWSIYGKPKNTLPDTLNKTAKKVVEQLEIDNGMKAKN
jgi:hypothetical protein